VVSLRVEVEDTGPHEYPPDAGTRRLSDVQLDEILLHEHGCSHEIKMINGLIAIVCADLTATWIPASAPPPPPLPPMIVKDSGRSDAPNLS
jgi:hypothetical protein